VKVRAARSTVMADGKCAEPKSVAAFLCNPTNASESVEQCGKGNAPSCGTAGTLYVSGNGGASRDEKKARELLGKGCDGSDTKSCTNLGVLLAQGRGGAKDTAAAAKNFEKSCGDADALACNMLGTQYKNGDGLTKDDAKAFALLQKGCEGGHDAACGTVGKMLLDGVGTAKDPLKAKDFLKRACDGTQAQACVELGNIQETNLDVIGAKIMYMRGCYRGNMKACFDQGRMELGFGGDNDSAKRAFEMGCLRNDTMSCAATKVLFGGSRPVFPGPETMELTNRCNGGSARDCGIAGLMNIATGTRWARDRSSAPACSKTGSRVP
jgi:TPR repeat protein